MSVDTTPVEYGQAMTIIDGRVTLEYRRGRYVATRNGHTDTLEFSPRGGYLWRNGELVGNIYLDEDGDYHCPYWAREITRHCETGHCPVTDHIMTERLTALETITDATNVLICGIEPTQPEPRPAQPEPAMPIATTPLDYGHAMYILDGAVNVEYRDGLYICSRDDKGGTIEFAPHGGHLYNNGEPVGTIYLDETGEHPPHWTRPITTHCETGHCPIPTTLRNTFATALETITAATFTYVC
ncbi:hypothetical protein ACFWPX_30100 [Nocardia sp. NPDC058518]|uniref:hypothetical protein n=1 Tax=Nocardia sp. NPDC058518 TaxID=3346534 RepID=UPI00365F790A